MLGVYILEVFSANTVEAAVDFSPMLEAWGNADKQNFTSAMPRAA
jgi:hypothetical protein